MPKLEGFFLELDSNETKKLNALATLSGFENAQTYLKHLIKLQYDKQYKQSNDVVNHIFGFLNAIRQ